MSKYKKNKAVALKYNAEEDASPVVIASGYGTVAEHIIDIAEKKGIPVFKDDSAASLLCMLEVGSNIPVELYEVVAAISGVWKRPQPQRLCRLAAKRTQRAEGSEEIWPLERKKRNLQNSAIERQNGNDKNEMTEKRGYATWLTCQTDM